MCGLFPFCAKLVTVEPELGVGFLAEDARGRETVQERRADKTRRDGRVLLGNGYVEATPRGASGERGRRGEGSGDELRRGHGRRRRSGKGTGRGEGHGRGEGSYREGEEEEERGYILIVGWPF